MTAWLLKYRVIALSASTLFSLIVLAVSAAYLAKTTSLGFTADTFNAFNVAVAVITLATVPAMLTIDRLRRGAVTSMIAVELGVFGTIAILWLAAAAFTSDQIRGLVQVCKFERHSVLNTLCKESQTAAAFGFLSWLSLTGYAATLLVTAVISQNHGSPVWKSTVRDANFAGDHTVAQNLAGAAMRMVTSETKDATGIPQGKDQQQQQQFAPSLPYTGNGQTPAGTPAPVYQQPQGQQQQMYQQPGYQQPDGGMQQQQQPNPGAYQNA